MQRTNDNSVDLQFEAGRLVKINGHRPEYMDGYSMIYYIQNIAAMLRRVQAAPENGSIEADFPPYRRP